MERIKQAIEKAKQQSPDAFATDARPAAPANDQPAEIGELQYERTKVVRLDAGHLERNRIVAFDKNAPTHWAFDLLRTQVLKKMEENGWRTLAITSPTPEAGKSVVSINLAMSIAHYTTRTALLVDFDLRRPRVGAYLGLPMEKSLNDVLSGEAEVQDAMVNPSLPRLVVLPTRKPLRHSAETLSSPKVANLIADLRSRYESRVIIFDLPPLLACDDAMAVLPKMDCVLLVVGNGMSTQPEIEEAMHHLEKSNVIGTVLNKAHAEPRPYYY
ncbi:MAG TPA: CpsD/CapB family tyrosine-protein kinase [Rhodocyclaceae bacterium]